MTKTKRYQVRNKKTKSVRRSVGTRDHARTVKRELNWGSKTASYEIFDLQNSAVIR